MSKRLIKLMVVLIVCLLINNTAFAYDGMGVRSTIKSDVKLEISERNMLTLKLARLLYELAPDEPGVTKDVEIAVNLPAEVVVDPQIQHNLLAGAPWSSSKFVLFDIMEAIETPKGTLIRFRNVRVDEAFKLDDPRNIKAVNDIISETEKYSSLRDKLEYINDRISLNAEYTFDLPPGVDIGYVLVDGKGVCTHFATTLKYLMKKLGIPSVIATNGSHMTTFVYVDGEWKLWDLTWNTNQGSSREIIYGGVKDTDGGKTTIIKGPANRKFFLVSPKSSLLEEYIVGEGGLNLEELLLNAEFNIAVEYPELLRDWKLEVESIKADINEVKDYIAKFGGVLKRPHYPDEIINPTVPVTPVTEPPISPDSNVGTLDLEPSIPEPGSNAGAIDLELGESVSLGIDENGKLVIIDKGRKATSEVNAKPTSSVVIINGKKVPFEAYNINGNNYFKLRDIAMALRDSNKEFAVEFDSSKNAIDIKVNSKYVPIGGELKVTGAKAIKKATATKSKVYVNDKEVQLTAYNIGGYNYFKLRDIGKVLNFGVLWDGKNNAIIIDTSRGYIE